jgi:hypothetical protein
VNEGTATSPVVSSLLALVTTTTSCEYVVVGDKPLTKIPSVVDSRVPLVAEVPTVPVAIVVPPAALFIMDTVSDENKFVALVTLIRTVVDAIDEVLVPETAGAGVCGMDVAEVVVSAG